VDMPVFFYIDPEFVKDHNMKGIEQVTLSYTFFSEWLFYSFGYLVGMLTTCAEARYDKKGHLMV